MVASVQARQTDGARTGHASVFGVSAFFSDLCEMIAPSPWGAHVGLSPWGSHARGWSDYLRQARRFGPVARPVAPPLYTAEERRRRDATPWTIVQGVLAPIQFVVFAVSLGLVVRYLLTGRGYELATASILVKTAALYAIMITGSIWEKVVFGKWLFARAFFWEDVFSMLVLALQTAYVAALLTGWASPSQQMLIAIAAYAVYVVNASQFLMKLRAARLEGASTANRSGPDVVRSQIGRPEIGQAA